MTEAEIQERAAAARERAAAVVTRADRPSQRRAGQAATSRPVVRAAAAMQLREASDGAALHFTGCASAYEYPYDMWDCFGPYTEIVTAGAGAQSLTQPDLDVPLVLSHDSLRRMARTTNGTLALSEGDIPGGDGQGLIADAPALDPTDYDVAYVAPKLRSGLLDEMSFMFRITSGQWSPDYMEYRINAYDIHRGDVAIVGYGANDGTSTNLRAARSLFTKLQVNRSLDAEDVNMLTQAMAWLSAIDNIVDEGQEALAAYLGVPNPDADDAMEALAAFPPAKIRALERALRRELARRELAPAMTLRDVEAARAG